MEEVKAKGVLYSGFLLAALGLTGAITRIEPLNTFSAPLLWWAYITLADSLLFSVKGESLIVSRTGEFLWMAPWSWAMWLALELLNSGLGLWSYVNLPASLSLRWGWYLAYGTALLPALYQSTAFLSWKRERSPSKAALNAVLFRERTLDIIQAVGTAALFLPIFLPAILFPLAIPALLLIVDPLNFRLKLPSVLGLLKGGEWEKIAAIAGAGLLCGLGNEACHLAGGPTRAYDFPFAGQPLLLGMPLAGYAAFPVLALTFFSLYSLVLSIRGGAGTDLLGREAATVLREPDWLPPVSYFLLFLIYYAGMLFLDSHAAALLIGWL